MKQETNLESRGLHEFVRIGRPDVWYDNRTSYSVNIEDFNRAIEERKRIGCGIDEEETGTIEHWSPPESE